MASLAPAYVPRRPTETVLYRLVRANLESFLAYARENYEGGLPRYVEQELRAYLAAAIFPRGRPDHNQYNSCSTVAEVRITRKHHPLEGQRIEVLMAGPDKVIARVGDGTTMRMPRGWTDIDGASSSRGVERVFSVDAILTLIELVDVLGRRA